MENKWEISGAKWAVLWVGPRNERDERALEARLCPYWAYCDCGPDGPARPGCGGWDCPQSEISSPELPQENIYAVRDWADQHLREVDVVVIAGEIPWQVMAAVKYWGKPPIPVYYYAPGERWVQIA